MLKRKLIPLDDPGPIPPAYAELFEQMRAAHMSGDEVEFNRLFVLLGRELEGLVRRLPPTPPPWRLR